MNMSINDLGLLPDVDARTAKRDRCTNGPARPMGTGVETNIDGKVRKIDVRVPSAPIGVADARFCGVSGRTCYLLF